MIGHRNVSKQGIETFATYKIHVHVSTLCVYIDYVMELYL